MKQIVLKLLSKLVSWEEIVDKLLDKLEEKSKQTDNSIDDEAVKRLKSNKELIVQLLKSLF